MKIQRAVYRKTGLPVEVCQVEEAGEECPGPGELGVRMEYAPVHPSDINQLEGRYGRSVELPAVPGGEGCGVVEQVGASVSREWLGRRVIVLGGIGTWTEWCTPAVSAVYPVSLDPMQAAVLRINPATAFRLLEDFAGLSPGDWVLQNAGNSAVGRAVAQIACARGIRVISVVRRVESIPRIEPGETVLADAEELLKSVPERTGGSRVSLALNAVGGESALRLGRLVDEGGVVVTYGGMARQPLRIPTGLLIFRDIQWRGFWLTRWWERAGAAEWGGMLGELERLAVRGVLRSGVDSVFGLGDLSVALERAQQGGRSGKVLLELSSNRLGGVRADG